MSPPTTWMPRAWRGSSITSNNMRYGDRRYPRRYFLDNVAGWILELDRGRGIPWKGNYSSWLEQKQERLRREEKAESDAQKTLQRELEWIRMSPKGRRQRSGPHQRSMSSCFQEAEKRERELKCSFRPARGWEPWSSRPTASPRPSERNCWWKTCAFNCPPARSSGSSAQMGPVKPPCFE
jgi:hypothetical protein